ncbi:glycosyltransferase family 4 protein [Candidatus Omnitrophota bacterium]
MKILLINTFFHICGGAEAYFFNLAELLKKHGHEVVFFAMDHPKNYETPFKKHFVSYFHSFKDASFVTKLKLFFRFFFPFEARRKIHQLIIDEKPDIVHIHQLFHEISHAIIPEVKKFNIPIVMTLHGYSFICPNAELFDGFNLCEACKDGKFYKMVFKECIFASKIKTLIMMLYAILYFNILKVYKNIDLFISPSKSLVNLYKQNKSFSNIKILHLPYCLNEYSFSADSISSEESIVYFGRLERVKGVDVLLRAVAGLDVTLKIIGTGPFEEELKKIIAQEHISNVNFLGFLDHSCIQHEIAKSLFCVVPSIYYDNYPNAIMESFALGKPVIASRLGGMPELVQEGITGYLAEPGNIQDLKAKIKALIHDKNLIFSMGKTAREWVEEKLNPEHHYDVIIREYERLVQSKRGKDYVS